MCTLLELSTRALGHALCWGAEPIRVEAIPELELVLAVYEAWQETLAAACVGGATAARLGHVPPRLPPVARQEAVLAAFAAAFWRPQLLRLKFPGPVPAGLSHLPSLSQRLHHLELSAPALLHLNGVAAACPQLRCLSLRGCTGLCDASMEALPLHLTNLRALDLGGLAALSDGACFHIARLPSLSRLSLSGTGATDAGLSFLTYGHKVRAWQRAEGVAQLPPDAAAWPALPVEHVQLAGTRVGAAGVGELALLPRLRFLDVRRTGIPRACLGPLQRRFALQFVQGAVLTSSNAAAAAVLNQDAVPCCCACGDGADARTAQGATAAAEAWEAAGVQLLLNSDQSRGLPAFLEPRLAVPAGQQAQGVGQARAPGAALGRLAGYRQPRRAPAPRGGAPGSWQQHRLGTEVLRAVKKP